MRIADEKARNSFIREVQSSLGPLKPRVVYLFGTHGTEYQRVDSDVDVAFLGPHAVDPELVSKAADALSEALHRDVDLIDLRTAPTTLRHVVLEEGECILCLDSLLRDEFEMYTLSDYAGLNEERKPILEDLQKELA